MTERSKQCTRRDGLKLRCFIDPPNSGPTDGSKREAGYESIRPFVSGVDAQVDDHFAQLELQ